MAQAKKARAPRNKTITLSDGEVSLYHSRCVRVDKATSLESILNKTINQDVFEVLQWLPSASVDLIFADPPYTLHKSFNGRTFSWKTLEGYEDYLETWLPQLVRLLKPNGTLYICGDWRSSSAIHRVAKKYLKVQNRITWEREKGRGAKSNWKNSSEDIWFCTKSDDYVFNLEDVKMKRRVIAPYKDKKGRPKDWESTQDGNFRLTHPSNLWTDLTVPFWSMSENTDHPTQKPEKLVAKAILASSNVGDTVLDPFSGSGTACVVAKKLKRNYIGIEIDKLFSSLIEKRLEMAEEEQTIQGYQDSVFLERNTFALQQKSNRRDTKKRMRRESKDPPALTDQEIPLFSK